MPSLRNLASGGQSPKIDIVAVHGLNPKGIPVKEHAWGTWTKPDPEDPKGRLWLRDDLPDTLEDARIFLYEYDSRIFSGNHGTFLDAGNEFLDRLRGARREEPHRPLILIGHSLGGLLIKQALVNAHDNRHYGDIETSVKGLVFFGTPHEGGNMGKAKINIGLTAAKIAKNLGFNPNDSIVKVLSPGSLFGDFLRESFRHQLENYFIVSFWEKSSTIVTKESATFGLAGHRETILGIEANHSNMCKFNTKVDEDLDIYESVKHNILWLYDEAMKEAALTERMDFLVSSEHTYKPSDLQCFSKFYESVSERIEVFRHTLLTYQPDESLDWVMYTSLYHQWNFESSGPTNRVPVLGFQTNDTTRFPMALGACFLKQGVSTINITVDLPCLSTDTVVSSGVQSIKAASLLLSILQQVYTGNGIDEDFSTYLVDKGIVESTTGKPNLRTGKIAAVLPRLLDMDIHKKWIFLIHDLDSLQDDMTTEVGRLLGGLFEASSTSRAERLRVAVVGGDPNIIPGFSRHSGVINSTTEYRECMGSLQFESMNNRRDRIVSATVGTNHWIWDNASYLEWNRKESSAIWIAGKPGSGKSVLAKTMQETLLSECGTTQVKSLVASWFYSARDNLTLHRQMLSALLHQLMAQDKDLFGRVKSTYRSIFMEYDGQLQTHWPIESLKAAISTIFAIIPESSKLCLMVVDGLDEANATDAGNDSSRRNALRFLLSLTSKALPLKIIFLSRPADDINNILKSQHFISMHQVNRPDIVLLVEQGVVDLARRLDGHDSDEEDFDAKPSSDSQALAHDSYFQKAHQEKKNILSNIEEYLKTHARGVVLWVATVITILKKSCKEEPLYDLKALKTHLEGLPLELSDLYSRITADLLKSFNGNQATLERSRRALMWVSVPTQYPLQLQDLIEIISYDFGGPSKVGNENTLGGFADWLSFKRSVERLCGPFIEFVTINPSTKKTADEVKWDALQLSHESVRTFLQQDAGSLNLGFSAAHAKEVVRDQRRQYMRAMLPALEPMLLSSIYQKADGTENDFCHHMESRSLVSFILLTLDLELHDVITQPSTRARLATEFYQSRDSTSIFFVYPFLNGASLLKACDFFNFIAPTYPSNAFTCGVGNSLLERLFRTVCAKGLLNAGNALSSLIIYPQRDQRYAILGAMSDTYKKGRSPSARVIAAEAQISTDLRDGTSDALERRWGISLQTNSINVHQRLLARDDGDRSIARRTPFL